MKKKLYLLAICCAALQWSCTGPEVATSNYPPPDNLNTLPPLPTIKPLVKANVLGPASENDGDLPFTKEELEHMQFYCEGPISLLATIMKKGRLIVVGQVQKDGTKTLADHWIPDGTPMTLAPGGYQNNGRLLIMNVDDGIKQATVRYVYNPNDKRWHFEAPTNKIVKFDNKIWKYGPESKESKLLYDEKVNMKIVSQSTRSRGSRIIGSAADGTPIMSRDNSSSTKQSSEEIPLDENGNPINMETDSTDTGTGDVTPTDSTPPASGKQSTQPQRRNFMKKK